MPHLPQTAIRRHQYLDLLAQGGVPPFYRGFDLHASYEFKLLSLSEICGSAIVQSILKILQIVDRLGVDCPAISRHSYKQLHGLNTLLLHS